MFFSSGDVFSSLNVPRVSEDRKEQKCCLDSLKICENTMLLHVSSLSQNTLCLEMSFNNLFEPGLSSQ